MEYEIVDIDEIYEDGNFEDEYVYDIEMADDTNHTFFANDILVHNSCYLSFGKLMDKLSVPDDYKTRLKVTRFFSALTLKVLDKYNETFFTENFNAPNMIFWDQELISDRGIFIKKKKYVCHIVEENGNPVDDLLVKGLEIVRSSTPKRCREKIKEGVSRVLKGATEKETQDYSQNVYNEFMKWPVSDISLPKTCNNLAKFDLTGVKQKEGAFDDLGGETESKGISFKKGAPQHMKGAIAHNFYLKHFGILDIEPIKEKDKFKMVILKNNNVYKDITTMGYINRIPSKFGIGQDDVDYMKHFELAYISPMKNILDAIGWKLPDFANNREDIDDLFD